MGDAPVAAAQDAIRARLLALQNPDGGWGATQARPSNCEATALSCLALGRELAPGARGFAWLAAGQRPDGSWPWTAELDEPSWASAEATLALALDGREAERVARAVEWLLGQQGQSYPWWARLLQRVIRTNELDSTLRGWPWTKDAFAWVEPTSLAVLALKAALPQTGGRRSRQRIDEAERMLLDRECPGGGWNYGNKRVLDQDMKPYPDTTALALLALQGSRADGARHRGFAALDQLVAETGSGLALSLAALCRRAWGLPADQLLARLGRRFAETGFLDETRVLALALLAHRDPGPLTLETR